MFDRPSLPLWMLAIALAGPACRGDATPDPGDDAGDEDDDDTGATSTGGPLLPDEQAPSDLCGEAPAVGQGRFVGTLRERTPDERIGGVCGGGGPDTFLRVRVPVRADLRVEARGNGFTPRVSLTPVGCLGAPMLACSADGVAGIDDLAEGSEVLLSIGADPAEFAALAAAPPPDDAADPLEFAVDIGMGRVLATGEVCLPAGRGRCAAGSLCMPELSISDSESESDGDGDDERWLCTGLAGDRCSDPERVAVALTAGAGELTVDPDLPQSDAHRHSCTGGGTRERVLQLRLPAGLGPLHSLQIRSDRPEVGLALRAPGCLAGDELGCAAPAPGGTQVTIVAPGELQAAGVEPYLFVELPEPGVLEDLVVLRVRVVLRAPPTSGG